MTPTNPKLRQASVSAVTEASLLQAIEVNSVVAVCLFNTIRIIRVIVEIPSKRAVAQIPTPSLVRAMISWLRFGR